MGCLILRLLLRVNCRQGDDDGHSSSGCDQAGCCLRLTDVEALLHGKEKGIGWTEVANYTLSLRSRPKLRF